jgi:hypothetical protein
MAKVTPAESTKMVPAPLSAGEQLLIRREKRRTEPARISVNKVPPDQGIFGLRGERLHSAKEFFGKELGAVA